MKFLDLSLLCCCNRLRDLNATEIIAQWWRLQSPSSRCQQGRVPGEGYSLFRGCLLTVFSCGRMWDGRRDSASTTVNAPLCPWDRAIKHSQRPHLLIPPQPGLGFNVNFEEAPIAGWPCSGTGTPGCMEQEARGCSCRNSVNCGTMCEFQMKVRSLLLAPLSGSSLR